MSQHCASCNTPVPEGAAFCPACGAATPAGAAATDSVESDVDQLGARLQAALGEDFRVEGVIGQGGFAMVFRVLDRSLNRPLAIKVISPDLILSKTVIERFRREAETIAQLSHGHIVPVHFVGHKEELFYLAMTFVDGESLADRLAREKQLPLEDAVRIFREVASALDLAHRRGVIHRDIKPHNVLLERESGRALLTDFGIARTAEGAHLTATGMVVGTPAYMSPEQVSGDQVDHRSDLYALGIMAYEMLTGRAPFTGATPEAILFKRVAESPEPIEKANPEVPADLAAIVNRCVASDPNDRVQSAAEIVVALGGATPSSGTHQTKVQPLHRRIRRRRRLVVAGATTGVAAVAGVLAVLLTRENGLPVPPPPIVPAGTVLIPGGTYIVGRDDGPTNARPAHDVVLDSFAIDSTEVTVGAYKEFMDSTGMVAPLGEMPDASLPITGVTWSEAGAYCAWRYEGGRLPTEEEWEAAARGPTGFRYPWGDTWREGAANTVSSRIGAPGAVAALPNGRSSRGVYDLVGNVWEWTSSRMVAYPGGSSAPGGGEYYVIRGGAFNTPDEMADASRRGYLPPATSNRSDFAATGFRCVAPVRRVTPAAR